MQLSIIIVNYNTSNLVADCVKSIIANTSQDLSYEIIVVDNASSQADIEKLKTINNINLVLSNENLGFGKGNNLGVKHSKGDILLFLNSDTILYEDSLNIMYNFFVENETTLNMGALGCELVDVEKKPNGSYYHFTNCKKIMKSYGSMIFKKLSPKDVPFKFNENGVAEVDFVIGADLMMRKDIFKKIGGFDKDYFMYFEEADMQLKLKELGLNRIVINHTHIIHLEGGSSESIEKLSNRRRIMIQQGKNLYLRKNDKKWYPFYVVADFIYSLARFFNKNYTFKENLSFFKKNLKSY
ncbi:glycosyltransferase family 2 protein [Ornithobacterium rhinotracheale]|uniref:glycosyltransferase family 2 protein n=1 Tax=Ornithobacterium rhinotracheale TaxID=28251 RepID=UPI004036E2F2